MNFWKILINILASLFGAGGENNAQVNEPKQNACQIKRHSDSHDNNQYQNLGAHGSTCYFRNWDDGHYASDDYYHDSHDDYAHDFDDFEDDY